LYEYRISFHPEAKIKRVRKRLLQILEDAPEYHEYKDLVAHDWSEKLVAAKRLSASSQPLEVTVRLFDEGEQGPGESAKTYTITITFVDEINAENLNRSIAQHSNLEHY